MGLAQVIVSDRAPTLLNEKVAVGEPPHEIGNQAPVGQLRRST
jgi:hypothetical protein